MGGWMRRAPRFCDVEEKPLRLERAGTVEFFAPHTRDHPATIPLISAVSERLCSQGVQARTHSIEDMKSAVMSISLKLSRMKLSKREKEDADALFALKDAAVRLEVVSRILAGSPSSALIEVHALWSDYEGPERFPEAGRFYRIPLTRMLYMKDHAEGYLAAIRRGLRVLEAPQGNLGPAIGLFGMSSASLMTELPGMLEALQARAGRTALVSIPAGSYDVEPFLERGTEYERVFGEGMSRKHTLSPAEIDILASSLS